MEIDALKTKLQAQYYRLVSFTDKKICTVYQSKHPTTQAVLNYSHLIAHFLIKYF